MSSLTPTNIAASVAQGALQQSQAARGKDKARNQAAYYSHKLRKDEEKHLESVEDSYETSDEHLTVRDDDPSPQKYRPSEDDGEPGERIDLTA